MKKKDDLSVVNEEMPGIDAAGNSGKSKKLAPAAIGFIVVGIVLAIIYGALDYRISQSDARLQMILDNVKEVKGSNVDLKGLENKIVDLIKTIDKKIDSIEVRVADLETTTVKSKDLNVTELLKLKEEVDAKLKILEENKDLLTRLAQLDKEGKLAILLGTPTAGSNASGANQMTPAQRAALANPAPAPTVEETPAEVTQITPPPRAPLPFSVVGIVEPTVVNVKINGQVYSININKSSIYDRYEIVVVNPPKQTVVVYDTQTNEYYTEKVSSK